MNKLSNASENLVSEMLEGYLAANKDLFDKVENTNGFILKNKKDKVSIVIGGGSGNEPWCMGYVGMGLADGVSLGNVYAAPPARSVLNVTRAVDRGKGVLYISGNHGGDVLNFELVGELAGLEGIKTSCIFINDDIASESLENIEQRRGGAGVAILTKIAGAGALAGLSLEELTRLAQKAVKNIKTISVTTSPGYMPGTGEEMFSMEDGMIEIGKGFNGEPGIETLKMLPVDQLVEKMMNCIKNDFGELKGEEVAVFLNSYGFTSVMELCIVNRKIEQVLKGEGVNIYDMYMGSVFAPQGTGGFSISVVKLDAELKKYYNEEAYSPLFYKRAIEKEGI